MQRSIIQGNFSNLDNYQPQPTKKLYPHHNDLSRGTPINKIFRNLIFNQANEQETPSTDFYSKKKMLLIKDYNDMLRKKDEIEYKREELQRRSMEQNLFNQRIETIQRGISPNGAKFFEYNKKYEPRTVFDEKKTVYNRVVDSGISVYPNPQFASSRDF